LEEKKLVKQTPEGYSTLAGEGRKLYVELHKFLPSIL
jgi:hypothetical protein